MLIGLTGRRRVGKNYVANHIKAHVEQSSNKSVELVAFADPLKAACKVIFGLTDRHFEGDKQMLTSVRWSDLCPHMRHRRWDCKGRMTARELLQVFGTQLMRELWSENVWHDAGIRAIRASNADVVVVTDVRFPNEASAIRGLGGNIWRITGPARGAEQIVHVDTHESETVGDQIHVDTTVANTGRDAVCQQIAALLPMNGGLFQ